MSHSEQSSEYKRLFERYNKISNEELLEIINPENEYTEIAKKVASDILSSDRRDYYENIKVKENKFEEEQKIDTENELLNISQDIHSIKNMMLFFVVLTVLGLLFGFYAVFVAIPNLF